MDEDGEERLGVPGDHRRAYGAVDELVEQRRVGVAKAARLYAAHSLEQPDRPVPAVVLGDGEAPGGPVGGESQQVVLAVDVVVQGGHGDPEVVGDGPQGEIREPDLDRRVGDLLAADAGRPTQAPPLTDGLVGVRAGGGDGGSHRRPPYAGASGARTEASLDDPPESCEFLQSVGGKSAAVPGGCHRETGPTGRGEGVRWSSGACRGGDRRSGRDRGGVVPRAACDGNEGRGGRPRAGTGGGGDRRAVGAGEASSPDVSRADSVEELADRTWERFGNCHLLVNNAGVGAPSANVWEDHPQRLASGSTRVNVMGVVHGILAFGAADDRLRRTWTRDQHLIRATVASSRCRGRRSTRSSKAAGVHLDPVPRPAAALRGHRVAGVDLLPVGRPAADGALGVRSHPPGRAGP